MKPPFPRLAHAPITEALIDFRVAPVARSAEGLTAFNDAVRETFPEQKSILALEVEVSSAPMPSATGATTLGYQLWSADRLRVVQARRDGFSFSHLRPYDRWEKLIDDARVNWDTFVRTTQPGEITRLAVRFINKIDLPMLGLTFESYLRTFPTISPDLPQSLAGLFMRLVLPRPEAKATVIVTEAFGSSGPIGTVLPFILDLEVAVDESHPVQGEAAWQRLNGLRDLKNDVFFNCLTPEALELFK